MKIGIMLYRFGVLGLLFAGGVLLSDPLKSQLARNHSFLPTALLLYGLPVLVGFTMLVLSEEAFRNPPAPIARLLKALSALTIFWLVLWCFIWAGMARPGVFDPFVRYLGVIRWLGPLLGLGGYLWAWKGPDPARKTARFLMVIGWNVSFMSFLNLHLDPSMSQLKGPAFGGLLVMAGVSMILRSL